MVMWLLSIVLLSPSTQPSDIELVRQRYVESVVPTDPTAQAELRRGSDKAASTIGEDGTWPDIDFKDQARSVWKPRQHLERAALMARTYSFSRDPVLLVKIKSALDYWLAHDYRNPNWWHNEIGTPILVGQIDVLLGSELTDAQKQKSLDILRRANWTKWTGQNLCWGVNIQILRGLIENNPGTVAAAYERLYQEIRDDSPEGIQPDWSFHQHHEQLYNGGYGLNFAQDVPRLSSYAWGTRWQIPAEKLTILSHYLLDGEQWMMRNQRIDYSTVGREITRRGKTAVPKSWTDGPVSPVGASYGLPRSIQLLGDLPIPRRDEFKTFAARLNGDPSAPPLVGNRHFWRSDYMVNQRPAYFASVKMFSTRTLNAELVNSEGLKSHHLSDGANFLYVSGDEYLDIFPAWDWTKIPGTTAEQNSLDLGEGKSIGIKGKTSFVGGASDGTYGLCVMQLARGKLAARKAWVFLDHSYVCLGTDITCDSDNPIATSVNQCLLNGKATEGPTWLHHNNVAYVFPDRSNVKFTAGPQEGRWSDIGTGSDAIVKKDVFNCWIDHGTRPTHASYVYEVFPGIAADHVPAGIDVEVIANSSNAQAIRSARLNLTAIAFFKPGTIAGIEVDQPCLLLARDGNVTLSNPENRALTVNVKIAGKVTTVSLPGGERAGSSVTANLPQTSAAPTR